MRVLSSVSVVSCLVTAGCPTESPSTPPAVTATPTATLFRGAVVLTMDPDHPVSDVLVIRDDRIVATTPEGVDAAGLRPSELRTVHADGRVILPGFIDSHVHVRELGMDALKADLVGTQSVDAMIARLSEKFPAPEPGQWLIGQGWDEGEFASRGYPDRAALDDAFPNNPVALESLHGFAGFYNGAALRAAGVDASTPDPPVGTILRRADDSPTGVLLTLAQDLVRRHVPNPTPEQLDQAILAGLDAMAAAGVTSIHEAGMAGADVDAFERLADRDALPIRVYGMLDGNDAELMRQWFDRGPLTHDSGRLVIRAIKVFYDGSLGSRTAVLAAPYHDAPDHAAPTERISPRRIAELAADASTHGFQMAVHAIGDEGNRRVLEVYEKALAMAPDLDHRWRIEHAQVVRPEFFARAARMQVIASMQPSHAVGDSTWAADRLGPERVERAYAWRSMLDAGVPLIFNSDLPGEPWTPSETLYFAVTRAHLDTHADPGWMPHQAVSISEALHAMTAAPAHAAFQESMIGTLAPGMKADLVVLDADPRSTPPARLADLRVLETWVDGVRVGG